MAKKKKAKVKASDFLSTGSTLLDLLCSGDARGGFVKGKYFFLVGDSSSGKTFLSLTCLAEASVTPSFDKYRFIHDNAEDGALMNIRKFFGSGVASRIEPPAILEDEDYYSSTIEEFYYHVDDAIEQGEPFIYILDSMDALTSKYETERFGMRKKAHREEKVAKGDYGDGKAKINSSHLRALLPKLRDMGSILIIINQTRDNLASVGFAEKTRSGGRALKFYATLEIWSAVEGRLSKTVNKIKRQTGIKCQLRVKKNRLTGMESRVTIPIYHSYGIDNIGSCVDYLTTEGHWKKRGGKIKCEEFEGIHTRDALIHMIEEEEMEDDLKEIVSEVWHEIQERTKLKGRQGMTEKLPEHVNEGGAWTTDQSERLLTLWLQENDNRFLSVNRIQRMVKRKTRRAIESQMEKLAIHYFRNESERALRKVDLGISRNEEEWNPRDLWFLFRATGRTSFEYGGHQYEVIAPKLGRSVIDVEERVEEFGNRNKGFGFGSTEPFKLCHEYLKSIYHTYLQNQ